jgi:predicted GIY-YIG superfamily endonuclease
MTCFVYVITGQCGGRYVGVTGNLLKRIREHLKADSRVGRAMRKRGWRPRVVFHGSREDCLRREIELISELGTISPGGFNLTSGGDGVVGEVPEVTEARSISMKVVMKDPERLALARECGVKLWFTKRKKIEEGMALASKIMSEKAAASWRDPEVRERRRKAISDGMKRRNQASGPQEAR